MTTASDRTVTVAAERLSGFLTRFAARHGTFDSRIEKADHQTVVITAADGAEARIAVPFPPLPANEDPLAGLLAHVVAERAVGVLLVRRGGHAVGIFRGRELLDSKVGSRYVRGRTKAGGWSQQRFARRRANQSRETYQEAADVAAQLLLPRTTELDAIITGGDRPGLAAVLADQRLEPIRPLVLDTVLAVPDPRLRVLAATPDQFLAVVIALNALA